MVGCAIALTAPWRALISGTADAVEELARSCRRGPRFAQVDSVIEEIADPPEEPGFLLKPGV